MRCVALGINFPSIKFHYFDYFMNHLQKYRYTIDIYIHTYNALPPYTKSNKFLSTMLFYVYQSLRFETLIS